MRVLRIVAGILTLLIALPVLAAGAVAWWAMQHRSPDGTFQAQLAPIESASRVVVIPDIDSLLRRDAPIARAERTTLRLEAPPGTFIGMAEPGALASYLAGASYTEITATGMGKGPLPVWTRQVPSAGEPLANPSQQRFWVRFDSGRLVWSPANDRDRQLALIMIAPAGAEPVQLSVAVTAAWLNSTTWGLLILGPVLLLLGLAVLAWPQRPREIVYVVDPATAANAGLSAPPQATWHSAHLRPSQPYQAASFYPPPPPAMPTYPALPTHTSTYATATHPGAAHPGTAHPGTAHPGDTWAAHPVGVPHSATLATATRSATVHDLWLAEADEETPRIYGAPPTPAMGTPVLHRPQGAPEQGTPGQWAPNQGGSGQGGPGQGGPGQGGPGQGGPGQGGPGHGVFGQGGPGQGKAEQGKPGQVKAGQGSAAGLGLGEREAADGQWPPAQAVMVTEPAREVPQQWDLPYDPDRPMPTAGMQLHLRRNKS
jgi:hypothetical protein